MLRNTHPEKRTHKSVVSLQTRQHHHLENKQVQKHQQQTHQHRQQQVKIVKTSYPSRKLIVPSHQRVSEIITSQRITNRQVIQLSFTDRFNAFQIIINQWLSKSQVSNNTIAERFVS